jgi:hypothetical protein
VARDQDRATIHAASGPMMPAAADDDRHLYPRFSIRRMSNANAAPASVLNESLPMEVPTVCLHP